MAERRPVPARPARPGPRRGRRSSGCRGSSSRRASGSSRSSCSARCCSARSRSSATRRCRRPAAASGVPIESLILPAVAAVACVGAIRLVPFGLWLAPALLVTGLHRRSLPRPRGADPAAADGPRRRRPDGGPGHDPHRRVPRPSSGVAATVPGGLAQPGSGGAAGGRCRRRPARAGRGRRGHRVPARLPSGRAARGDACATRCRSAADLRGGHRDRGRGRPGDGDPAAARPGAADARLLPVGRVPRPRPRRAAAMPAGCGRRVLLAVLGIAVIAWNLLLRAEAGRLRRLTRPAIRC